MPPVKNDNWHLFLSVINNSRSVIWYKAGISVGEGMIRSWMRTMAKNAGVEGDITNKSGRVTSITRMIAARVPPEVIAKISGHRNLNTLSRYDRVALLKARAAHVLLRHPYENGQLLDFETVYAREMAEYNRNQLGEDIIRPGHDVLPDGTALDDPNDMNGFIDDCDGEEEVAYGDSSHSEDMDYNSTIEDPSGDHEIRGPIVATLESGHRASPSVPMPPNTRYGIVTHVQAPVRPPSGFTKMTNVQASRGTQAPVRPPSGFTSLTNVEASRRTRSSMLSYDYPSGGGNLRLENNPRRSLASSNRGIYPGRTTPIVDATHFRPVTTPSQHILQQGGSPRPLTYGHGLSPPYHSNYPRPRAYSRPSPSRPPHVPIVVPRPYARPSVPVVVSRPRFQENLGSLAYPVESSESSGIFHDCVVIDWASFELREVSKKIDIDPPGTPSSALNHRPSPSSIDSFSKADPASIIGHDGNDSTSIDSTSRDDVTAQVKTVAILKRVEEARESTSPISSLGPSKTNAIVEVPHHSEVIVTHPSSPVMDSFGLRAIFAGPFVNNQGNFSISVNIYYGHSPPQ